MLIELENERVFKEENLHCWEQNTSFWLSHHLLDKSVQNLIAYHIRELSSSRKKKTIVDLGCGNGWLLSVLRKNKIPFLQYTGIDYNPRFIDYLHNQHTKKEISFLCLDIEKKLAGHISEPADIVVSCLSFIETPNLEKVFRNISEIIASKGIVIIVSLNPVVEIFRDSKTMDELTDNLNFYIRKKEKTVISKRISDNNDISENDYFRILYSVDSYVKAAAKHGLKLLDIDKIHSTDKTGSIKPLYEFIRFTK